MAKFEVVSRFADSGIEVPVASTKKSAGYDFVVAEDIDVPAYEDLTALMNYYSSASLSQLLAEMLKTTKDEGAPGIEGVSYTLDELAKLTKSSGCKPTLVSTGLKCKMEDNEYLQIVARSSTPLKYWLIVANAPGIVDADYYNNPDNEGEIFVQIINLSPFTIKLKKGDKIAQGIVSKYYTVEDDIRNGERTGGFGSTGA